MVGLKIFVLSVLILMIVAESSFAERYKIVTCKADMVNLTNQKATEIDVFFNSESLRGDIIFTMNKNNHEYDGVPVVEVKDAEVLLERKQDYDEAHRLVYVFDYKGARHYSVNLYNLIYDNGSGPFYGPMDCDPAPIAHRIDYTTGRIAKKALDKYTGEDDLFSEETLQQATSGRYRGNFPVKAGFPFPKLVEVPCALTIARDGDAGTVTFSYPKNQQAFDLDGMSVEVVDGDGLLFDNKNIMIGFYHYYSLARKRVVIGGATVWKANKTAVIGCQELNAF